MNNLVPSDHDILMHRDAHFGGKFEKMLDYYKQGKKGVNPDFELERILYLYDIERDLGANLSIEALDDEEKDKVEESIKNYETLRALSHKKNRTIHALLAELILSEEEPPQKEIDAIVALKGEAVKPLIDVIKDETYYDPLSPGYGLIPGLVTQILGLIGDKRAIIALFEEINQGDFFDDEIIFKALKQIGTPSKQFLLKVLHAKPITADNEKAAQALHIFEDPEVSVACLNMLKSIDLKKNEIFASYLILNCENLNEKDQIEFKKLENSIPKNLKTDFSFIIQGWQKIP